MKCFSYIYKLLLFFTGTGSIDSPDGTKITSSAYLFRGDKEKPPPKITPSNSKPFDSVKLNIKVDTDETEKEIKPKKPSRSKLAKENARYNVI